LSSRKNPN